MNNNLQPSDHFSFRRMLRFGKFYLPTIKIQLLIYFGAAVLSGIITLLPLGFHSQLGLFTIIWMILPFLVEAAPCAFAQKGYLGPLERMMPVRSSEKFLFYMIYFCIVIPVVTLAIPELSLWLYQHIPAIQTKEMSVIVDLHFNNALKIKIINLIGAYAAIITSLYVIGRARTNRVLKGILSVIGVMFMLAIIGMVYGLFFAFENKPVSNCDLNCAPTIQNQEIISSQIMDNISTSTIYIPVSMLILGGFSLWMTILFYRQLTRKNI